MLDSISGRLSFSGGKLKRLVFALWVGAVVFPLAAQGQDGGETPADPRAAERGLWFDGAASEEGRTAADGAEVPALNRGAAADGGLFSLIRLLFVLALAALAVYGVVSFLKKRPRSAAENDRYLKLLAAIPLGTKNAAAVIAVGGKAWLAGVTDSSVSLLAEITDKETVDAMTLEYEQRAAASPAARAVSFAGLLRRIVNARTGAARQAEDGGREGGADGGTSQAEKLRSYRDRLRGL